MWRSQTCQETFQRLWIITNLYLRWAYKWAKCQNVKMSNEMGIARYLYKYICIYNTIQSLQVHTWAKGRAKTHFLSLWFHMRVKSEESNPWQAILTHYTCTHVQTLWDHIEQHMGRGYKFLIWRGPTAERRSPWGQLWKLVNYLQNCATNSRNGQLSPGSTSKPSLDLWKSPIHSQLQETNQDLCLKDLTMHYVALMLVPSRNVWPKSTHNTLKMPFPCNSFPLFATTRICNIHKHHTQIVPHNT